MRILFVVNWYTLTSSKTWMAGVFHREQSIALKKYCDIRLYWPLDTEIKGLVFNDEAGLETYRSEWDKTKSKVVWFIKTLKYFDEIISEFKPDIIHACGCSGC